jgi:EmrB/QacA subfamily drug resistance transporter
MSTHPLRTVEQAGGRRTASRATLVVVCLALATVVSAVASLNVAIPSIASDTRATQTELAWVIDAYALVFAALLLPAGALGDRYGRRRALLAGLAVFAAAALAATARADVHWLIGMRAVLGLGAALVMPATLSTVTSTFPDRLRSRAVGTWAGVAGASAILGLLSSGLLLQVWSWRSVFAFSAVLAVVALVATAVVVPESADPQAPRVDTVGAGLSIVGLGVLVHSIIEAPTRGWASGGTLLGLVGGAVVLLAFVAWELRAAHPLLDPRLFRRAGLSAGTVTVTTQFFVFFGFIFLFLQYLQLVQGRGPLDAALRMLPLALGLMPAARGIAPRLAEHLGAARTSAGGLLVAAAAIGALSRMGPDTSFWALSGELVVLGLGMGLAMTPATSSITDALPHQQQGVGSALNDLARELGGALGIAVLGSLLQSTYRSGLDAVPEPAGERARSSLAAAVHLGPDVASRAQDAFVDGIHVALLTGSAALAAAAAVTIVLARHLAK